MTNYSFRFITIMQNVINIMKNNIQNRFDYISDW